MDNIMDKINAPIKQIRVTSGDGTDICAYICGSGKNRWLLPPGLGTPVMAWKYLFEYFKDHMTIVTWEPRGCYNSEAPDDLDRMYIDDHVADGLALIKHLGWDQGSRFVTGGWSMGVEIGLELYDRLPERIKALTLINGTFEYVLKTAFQVPFIPFVDVFLKNMLKGVSATSFLFSPASHYLLGKRWTIWLLQNLGLVAENKEFFGEVVQTFRDLDFGVYFPMMLKLNEHSANRILNQVRVPTLITAGTKDKMTPLYVSEYMHAKINESELFIIPNGTHYATLEYPEIVNLKLEQFFRNRAFKNEWE
jgi:pimeloyl-ACP methyl ester carboxylesterase